MSTSYYETPNSSRKIPLIMRPGMQIECIHYQSEPNWVVKDAHDQEYYQFNVHEYAVLSMLNGEVTFDEVCERFSRDFAPYRINFRELMKLLTEFFQKSVVVPCRDGVGFGMHEFSREKRRKKLQQKLKNILAIRWKGWDPQTFLDWTYPLVGWFFSKPMVILNITFFAAAIGWLGLHYSEFVSRLPNIWSFLDSDNWLLLGFAIVSTKLLHEFGHAYAAKRMGSECHEIGVMIFFFMPTLYCNTSDSWLLQNKWKRIAIAVAGVYIELFLLSAATFGWWFSDVGPFQSLCLNLMLICSVSAAVTNGNPLLKYDGYFALADWMEMPNLQKKSNAECRRVFLKYGLGIEKEYDFWTPRFNKGFYVVYAIAAFAFRMFLMVIIPVSLIGMFNRVGFGYLGLILAAVSVVSSIYQPCKSIWDYFKNPGNRLHVKKKYLSMLVLAMLCLTAFLGLVPLPFSITTECVIVPQDESKIYVSEAGELTEVRVRPGELVERGQCIARLKNDEIENAIIDKQLQLEQVKIKLAHMNVGERLSFDAGSGQDRDSLDVLIAAQHELDSTLLILRRRKAALAIHAERTGMVYGVVLRGETAETEDAVLNQASGSPLDPKNLGAWIPRDSQLCRIGSAEQLEAVIVLQQKHNQLIQKGQRVSVLLDAWTQQRIAGRIDSISASGDRPSELPDAILTQSKLPAVKHAQQIQTKQAGKKINYKDGQTLESTLSQARVTFRNQPGSLNVGSLGKARIHVGKRTIFWRVYRVLQDFFQKNF